jgi:hypothetical protein
MIGQSEAQSKIQKMRLSKNGFFTQLLDLVRPLAKQVPLRISDKPKTGAKEYEKADKSRVVHHLYPT